MSSEQPGERTRSTQAPNKDSAFLPVHECRGILPRFGDYSDQSR
jgi:hypothetical protein